MWSPERSCIGARSRPIVVVFSRCVLSFIVRMIFIAHRRRGIQQLVLFCVHASGLSIAPGGGSRCFFKCVSSFVVRMILIVHRRRGIEQLVFFLRSCIGPFDRAWRWISLSLFFSSACHPLLSACLWRIFNCFFWSRCDDNWALCLYVSMPFDVEHILKYLHLCFFEYIWLCHHRSVLFVYDVHCADFAM